MVTIHDFNISTRTQANPLLNCSRPNGDIVPAYSETPSNLPGKTVVGLKVTYPPNGATPPHTHGGAAVFATMIRGKSCMQMVCPGEDPNGQGSRRKIFGPGESWHEPPGCHHVLSSNASEEEECEFIATLIVDTERIEKLGIPAPRAWNRI